MLRIERYGPNGLQGFVEIRRSGNDIEVETEQGIRAATPEEQRALVEHERAQKLERNRVVLTDQNTIDLLASNAIGEVFLRFLVHQGVVRPSQAESAGVAL